MPTLVRKIIRIDEEKCDGCGLCVPACAEGALQVIDGKARLVSERYCDGLGACLGDCPQGAISFEEREAEDYDHDAVIDHLHNMGREYVSHPHNDGDGHHSHAEPHSPKANSPHGHAGFTCPSARTLDFRTDEKQEESPAAAPMQRSELGQWPVKLNLVNPRAPYFQDADLLVSADCAPFAYASLHPEYLKGKALVIGCPKFDDLEYYQEKLTAILQSNNIKSITVMHMEVPCCSGLLHIAREAVAAAGKDIPIQPVRVSLRGEATEH